MTIFGTQTQGQDDSNQQPVPRKQIPSLVADHQEASPFNSGNAISPQTGQNLPEGKQYLSNINKNINNSHHSSPQSTGNGVKQGNDSIWGARSDAYNAGVDRINSFLSFPPLKRNGADEGSISKNSGSSLFNLGGNGTGQGVTWQNKQPSTQTQFPQNNPSAARVQPVPALFASKPAPTPASPSTQGGSSPYSPPTNNVFNAATPSTEFASHNASTYNAPTLGTMNASPSAQASSSTQPQSATNSAANGKDALHETLFSRIAKGFMNALANPEIGQIFQGLASQKAGETWEQTLAHAAQNQQEYHSRYALLQREGVDPQTAQNLAVNSTLTNDRLENLWKGRGDNQLARETAKTGANPHFEKALAESQNIDQYDQKCASLQKIKQEFQKRGGISMPGLEWDEAHQSVTGNTAETQDMAHHVNSFLGDMPKDFREQFLQAEAKNDRQSMTHLLDYAQETLSHQRGMHLQNYRYYRNWFLPEKN